MYAKAEKSKGNKSKASARSVGQSQLFEKQTNGIVDNRSGHVLASVTNGPVLQQFSAVAQMGGGSHYWRKQDGGAWIYSGKFGTHKVATSWHVGQGYTNGNGWQFSQGGKKNPPGT